MARCLVAVAFFCTTGSLATANVINLDQNPHSQPLVTGDIAKKKTDVAEIAAHAEQAAKEKVSDAQKVVVEKAAAAKMAAELAAKTAEASQKALDEKRDADSKAAQAKATYESLCPMATNGSCSIWACDSARGPTDCVPRAPGSHFYVCLCQFGTCARKVGAGLGKCFPAVAAHGQKAAVEAAIAAKEAATQKTGAWTSVVKMAADATAANQTAAAELRAAEEKEALDVAAADKVCLKDTTGVCDSWNCDAWRGLTECVQTPQGPKRCFCPLDLCAKDGFCVQVITKPTKQLELQSTEGYPSGLGFTSAFAAVTLLATFLASWAASRRPWRSTSPMSEGLLAA